MTWESARREAQAEAVAYAIDLIVDAALPPRGPIGQIVVYVARDRSVPGGAISALLVDYSTEPAKIMLKADLAFIPPYPELVNDLAFLRDVARKLRIRGYPALARAEDASELVKSQGWAWKPLPPSSVHMIEQALSHANSSLSSWMDRYTITTVHLEVPGSYVTMTATQTGPNTSEVRVSTTPVAG